MRSGVSSRLTCRPGPPSRINSCVFPHKRPWDGDAGVSAASCTGLIVPRVFGGLILNLGCSAYANPSDRTHFTAPIHSDFTLGSINLHGARLHSAIMKQTLEENLGKSPRPALLKAFGFVAIGVALGAVGIYVGDTDDAPGAALIGILLMIIAVALGVRTVRRKS